MALAAATLQALVNIVGESRVRVDEQSLATWGVDWTAISHCFSIEHRASAGGGSSGQ